MSQLQLFQPPKQPRSKTAERATLYEAVRTLRRKGYRVYRAGRKVHRVNDLCVTTAVLLDLARAL